jgi:cytoskeletal protein CcmA (bactofilin family)/Tfp pilus assembly protein PilX
MKRLSREDGIAMVTALLASVVVLFLSVAVVGLSLHNSTSSSFDRKRVQAVDAAEAGIDAYFSKLTGSTGLSTCDPIDADLTSTPTAHYRVDIQLYSAWPPTDATKINCSTVTSLTNPAGAMVTSKGTAVATGSPVAVSRTMQSEVRMTPIYGGLGQAIFSDTGLSIQNKFTLNGNVGNDGDVYTNGNFTLSNNTVISGTVYSQGSATISQGIVKGNVWAKNAVSLSSGLQVYGNTTSSTSSIGLSSNSTIQGNAKAGTSITGGTVLGTKTPNSPSGPPPVLALPQVTYVQQAWIDAGYTVVNYSNCTLAKTFIQAGAVGNYVVRISPACALSFSNNSTINVRGNLAIVTDGSIATVNQTNWNAIGGNFTLYWIRPYQAGLNCAGGTYDLNVSNNTNFNNLSVFAYSQCTVNFANNNAGGSVGQIIGGTVNITNQCTMNYKPIVAPGFNLTGFNVAVSYLREIRNS